MNPEPLGQNFDLLNELLNDLGPGGFARAVSSTELDQELSVGRQIHGAIDACRIRTPRQPVLFFLFEKLDLFHLLEDRDGRNGLRELRQALGQNLELRRIALDSGFGAVLF